jgi:transposase
MPHSYYHNFPKKNRFIGRLQAGLTISEAAQAADIPQQTASDLARKFRETGSTHARARSGRPRKITDHTKRTVIREANAYRRKPLSEIGNLVQPEISATLVRNILGQAGLHRRRA